MRNSELYNVIRIAICSDESRKGNPPKSLPLEGKVAAQPPDEVENNSEFPFAVASEKAACMKENQPKGSLV